MRILYVIPRYWPSLGGAQAMSRELIQRMSVQHQVHVVTHHTEDRHTFWYSLAHARAEIYQDGNVTVERVGPQGPLAAVLRLQASLYGRPRLLNPLFARTFDMSVQPQLRAIIQRFRPDVVHGAHVGLVYASETAWRAAHSSSVPFVWTPFPHIEGGGWRGPRFVRLYRVADALTALTQVERNWLVAQGAAAEKVHVLPPGPLVPATGNGTAFRQRHGLGDAPVVLFLAQKLAYKGYQQLAGAAPLVWSQRPDVCFVFVGPRTPESEAFFATQHDRRLVELPAVSDEAKADAYDACTIFCMPSTQESFGMVYLEAWQYAKPVIGGNIGILNEIITDATDGLLVSQDAESIARGVLRILQNPELAQTMGRNGQEKAKSSYSWERTAELTAAMYADLTV